MVHSVATILEFIPETDRVKTPRTIAVNPFVCQKKRIMFEILVKVGVCVGLHGKCKIYRIAHLKEIG
jgi:hypothetical protein